MDASHEVSNHDGALIRWKSPTSVLRDGMIHPNLAFPSFIFGGN